MRRKKVANYVKNKIEDSFQRRYGTINVFIKDSILNDVNLKDVFAKIQILLPSHIIDLVSDMYIGDFDFLRERSINASFLDGAIYISSEQDSEDDMLDDIIHEFAHAIEEKYGWIVYEDGNLHFEFLRRRLGLERVLKAHGFDTDSVDFKNIEFDQDFDDFLYREVGYEKLSKLISGLFVNPYSPTSLREYFASGFEEFYLGDRGYLMKVCPYIYKKVLILHEGQEDEF